MKKTQVRVGMKVKVSEDSKVIYRVEEIDGFQVRLSYRTEENKKVSGGWTDVSVLKKVKMGLSGQERDTKMINDVAKLVFGL